MNARYYDPAIGRFLSHDPVFWNSKYELSQLFDPQNWNSYAYARNNPYKFVDPDGDFPVLAMLAGAIIGAAISYFSNPQNVNAPSPGQPTTHAISNKTIATNGLIDIYVGALTGASISVERGVAKIGKNVNSSNVQQKSTNLNQSVQTRFVTNVTVNDRGSISKGTIDLQPTFDRINSGNLLRNSRNDGTTFSNREGRLPAAIDSAYYTEYVVQTPGINNRPGPQRLVVGKGGEAYYSNDHYQTFTKVKEQEGTK